MTPIDLSQYKSLYLKTANEYLVKLINSLETLKANPNDKNAIVEAHLSVHSLASQSYAMGFTSTGDLAKALESFFSSLKENNQTLPSEYFTGIEESVNKLQESIKSIEQTSQEMNTVSESTTAPKTIDKQNLSILLAEDDKFFQNFYAKKLIDEGMKVEVAIDGQDAIEKLQVMRPDLILLDLIMPRKNGFEVLQSVAANEKLKGVPILVFSTLEQESDIEKAKQLGATDYVNKTFFDFDNLLKKINEITHKS